MNADQHREFRLGQWQVRPLRGVLQGPEGTRRVTPKSMDVLLCLVARAGEVVDRETFLRDVWHGRAFSDDPLNKCIAELRRQLGDRAGTRDYIETIPKRGYRLVADVEPIGDPLPAAERHGVTRHLRLAALGVLCVLAGVGVWRLSEDVSPRGDTAIAVLPFANLSESGKQYFADSVHEELIGELAKGDALAVRSRTTTLQYRDSSKPLPEIARELDVDVIVEGSVRRDGDTVRVTAQLIRADVDENLWTGSIEKSMSVASLFSIQNEIAREIANALKVTLSDDKASNSGHLPTDNVEAYDAFTLGKFHYRRQLPGDLRESVRRFERAVALDPGFADAWDWLAYAYNHAATLVGYLAPKEAYPKARAAALRALELEPELATAKSILGYIRAVYDRDWIGAVADLQRAVDLAPLDSGTVWSLAHVYSMLGRHEDAIRLAQEFATRFPEAGRNHQEVANRLIDAERFDDALSQLEVALARGAEPAVIANSRGAALVGLDRMDEAASILEFAVDARQRDAGTVGRLAHVYGRLGNRAKAETLLDELLKRAGSERISRLTFATVNLGLGDAEAAIEDIRAAAEVGGRDVLEIRNDPFFAALRDRPDFQALVASLGLPSG